jgi:hypothetical protein
LEVLWECCRKEKYNKKGHNLMSHLKPSPSEKHALNLAAEYVQAGEPPEKQGMLEESCGHLGVDVHWVVAEVKRTLDI